MADPRLILCGGLGAAGLPRGWAADDKPVRLAFGKGRRDVHFDREEVERAISRPLVDETADLLDLAAFVYAADQAVGRGGMTEFEYGAKWRRHLRLAVPVRRPELWGRSDVGLALRDALGWATDDRYEFHFAPRPGPGRPRSDRRGLIPDSTPGDAVEEVMLFSGGLDSLCGAVDEVLAGRRKVALVSHRSCGQTFHRQANLAHELRTRAVPRAMPVHVAVTANKGKSLTRDFTQRSRSFLYLTLAAAVARGNGLSRVRVYENGVTSLNLPISPQVVGGRASRTTHPQTLVRFGTLFGLVFGEPFRVENPYEWSTKAEVLARLKAGEHADLARLSRSCVRTMDRTVKYPHCGVCSQCVDRFVSSRAATLADEDDPESGYEVHPLTGHRANADLVFAERYSAACSEIREIPGAAEFAVRYPEVLDAASFTDRTAGEAVTRAYDLYRRHAEGVHRSLTAAVSENAAQLVDQQVSAQSLLVVSLGNTLSTGATPQRQTAPKESGLVVDADRFEVRWDGRPCPLGNRLEFRLMGRLAQARERYVPVPVLGEDVWGDAETPPQNVARVVSNLRRRLREHGLGHLDFDGRQHGHYRLVVRTPAEAAS